jgi:hypothetical protein
MKRSTKDKQNSGITPGDEEEEKGTVAFTVRYRADDIKRLGSLETATGIGARYWLRALLPALLEAFESRGNITVPLAVVPRREALASGLIKTD